MVSTGISTIKKKPSTLHVLSQKFAEINPSEGHGCKSVKSHDRLSLAKNSLHTQGHLGCCFLRIHFTHSEVAPAIIKGA
jgi:hypothetical protein